LKTKVEGQGFNITTIKYAPNGAQLWVQSHHTAGSDFDAAQGIAVSDAGEVYVIGSNGTGINILPTGAVQVNQTLLDFDFTTIKYSTGGFQQWVRTFDGTIDGDLDVPHDLVLDDQGNVFIAGVSQGPSAFDTGLNFGFGVTGNFTNIIQGAGTGITVFIPELPVSIGSGPGDNGTTLKYDASGDLIFAEIFDTPEGAQDGFFGIDLDDDGNVYASGFSAILDANNNFGVKFTTVKYTECKEIPEISVLIDGSDNTPTVRDTVSNTFDRFGNIFLPEELRLISSTHGGGHCVAGIFAVDFFGPEFSTDPNAQDMRNVVCQVFGDISALLVNSQCNNVDPVVQIEIHSDRDLRGALATASSRYTTCGVTDRNGILYGNVWKAINTGVNGPEYDGSINVRFDPQTVLTGSFWNFDPRNATTGALEFDLYTVILHEILHLLGFNTFISNNGTSSISTTFGDFYSKYDTYLEDGNSNPLIVITDGCYNAVFNPSANVSDLTAGCGQINYNGPIGGFNPVHAPATFRLGTSISHFDIPCVGPPPFYVMDPFIPTTFDLRRVLTVEEVGVLCDLGYQTTGNFGDASGFFGSLVGNHTVGGLPSCGQIVAGTNDGFPNTCAQSRYVVPGCVGSTITIPILDNDPGATSYRCLEILTGEGTILSQGMTSFVFRVDPLKPCIVTLRYIPENGNISGNTTCVSIEVTPCGNTTCATATNCNQVCNPDFTDPTDCSVAPSAGACQNNPFVLCAVPNWIRSHGTPQISTIGNPTAATMWALHDNIVVGSRGEGIITKFVACTTGTRYIFTYIRRATFGVTTDNIRAVFAIQGTSGLPLPSTTETSTPPRPLLDEQEVVHETNVAVNPLFEQVTVCFTANDNYDMLWIYPEQNPGNNQAFMDVDFVGVIEDVFSAGPDQVINCGVTTIGLPTTCELRGMGFQWTVLSGDLQSISRVIGTDPTQTVIQVEPTVTTTYKLTRTFVPNPSSVVIGNQAGCVLMDQVTVTVTNPVDASFILSNNTSCANAADGVAGVLPSGGTPPYTFQWSTVPIQTGASATGLTAGTYFVTVTDAAGCRGFGAVTITEPTTNITATFTTTDVSCIGADDGSINLTPVTSVPPLSFVWSNGLNTEDISGLTPGTYTVRINDATPSCFIIEDITIGILPPIVITEDNVAGACSQGTLGSIDITVSGGTPPFGFIWSDLNTTEDRTGLTADTYTVTVTDVNGCTAEETFIVPELTSPRINAIRVGDGFCPPSNFQQGLLALILGQNDGTPPFTFLWSDGQITKNPVGLTSGTYTVTVTDANGCTTVGEHTLTNAVDLDIQIAADITDLCAVPGTLSVTSSFPDPMRFYQWFLNGDEIAGATDPTFIITDPNATGGYHLRVITFDGCEKITDVILLKCAPTEPDFTLDIQGTLIAGITSCKSSEFTSANCKSCALKRYTVTFCNIGQNAVETCDLVINIDPKSEFREFQEIRFIPIGGEPSEPGVSNGEKTITIPNVLCDMRCGVVVFDVEIPISVPDCIGASVPLDLSVDYFDSGIGSNQETEHLDHTQTYDGPDDPNNKLIVFPEPVACPFVDKDDTVVFQINFQNEGFAPARDVILVDTIDISALDISTFDILHASHTAQFSLSPGGVLTIHYLNINLPDIGSDPEGSIGFAKFSFMPLSSVTAGTVFENKAAIFFDFNPPVITNTVSRTIVDERTVTVDAGIDQTIFIGFGDTCVTLTATPSGALPPYIFEWSNGETTQSIEVCSEEAGTFSVIADASGCVSQPDSVTVEVIDVRCGNKNDRVLVCHVPSGNSGNEHEICVNPNAVAAHLAHGDRLGPCDRPVGKKGDSSDKNEGLEQINQISLSEPLLEAYPNPFNNTFDAGSISKLGEATPNI